MKLLRQNKYSTIKFVVIFTFITLIISAPAFARRVRGYMRSDGTYVHSYHRTNKDHSKSNNYSAKGNTNPYTGKKGTVNKDINYDKLYYGKKNKKLDY